MSELSKRILFAVIAAPAGILAIYLGDAVLATLLGLIAGFCAWEFCRIARSSGAEPFELFTIGAAALVPVVVHGQRRAVLTVPLELVVIVALAVFAATIFFRSVERRPLLATATTLLGIAYSSLMAYVYVIRYHPYTIGAAAGTALAALPILLTWATDTGAYIVGRSMGKRKLIPSVSPSKTVAGAVGGLALSVLVCWLYVEYVLRPTTQLGMPLWGTLLFGAVISVAAQLGDIAESLLKRAAGIKHSSHVLPGHGGVLDRFDGMLFALPVAMLMLNWLLMAVPQ